MKDVVRRALNAIGWDLVNHRPACDFAGEQFSIPIELVRTSYNFSYLNDPRNPFLFALACYRDAGTQTDSVERLFRHTESLRLRTAADVAGYDDNAPRDLLELSINPAYVPFRVMPSPMPWSLERHLSSFDRTLVAQETRKDSHGRERARSQISRVGRVYESIRDKGFNEPQLQTEVHKRFICVAQLRHGDQLRFIVLSGQHRVAALAALDYDEVPVILSPFFAPIVDRSFVEQWAIVRHGTLSRASALALFDAFFGVATD